MHIAGLPIFDTILWPEPRHCRLMPYLGFVSFVHMRESPFFHSPGKVPQLPILPKETGEEWDKIFKVCGEFIDICAFQDGTCALEDYPSYLEAVKKVCDKYSISLWANVETFERDVRNLYFPIGFDLLKKKIELAKPFVQGMITFEFSHFLSPQSIFESGRNLNSLYKKYYK